MLAADLNGPPECSTQSHGLRRTSPNQARWRSLGPPRADSEALGSHWPGSPAPGNVRSRPELETVFMVLKSQVQVLSMLKNHNN